MYLLHQNSAETVDSGLDIFAVPPTQTSIESGGYVEYFPLATLDRSTNIEFNILNKRIYNIQICSDMKDIFIFL